MKEELSGRSNGVVAGVQPEMVPELKRRRRILIGGGVGAILATVKSGSALAGGQCVAPSAFSSISANPATSHRPQSFGQCSSRGWYGDSGGGSGSDLDPRWAPVSRASATLATAGFPTGGLPSSTLLYDIVKVDKPNFFKINGNPDGNLIVVYLDVITQKAQNGMTVQDVFDMWSILFGSGTTNLKLSGWTPQTVRDFYYVWVGKALI